MSENQSQPTPTEDDLNVDEVIENNGGIYGMFGTDRTMETQGIVLRFGQGISIKIARSGGHNQAFSEAYNRRFRPYNKKQRTGTLSEAIATQTLAEVYAEAVIKDWEGIKDPKGNAIPFNFKNVVKLLLDLPDLFTEIRASSAEASLFRAEEVEQASKNS